MIWPYNKRLLPEEDVNRTKRRMRETSATVAVSLVTMKTDAQGGEGTCMVADLITLEAGGHGRGTTSVCAT